MDRDFERDLTAIWLVFGSAFLNHSNAPVQHPDHREQILLNLLCSYLEGEIDSSYDSFMVNQLATLRKLLQLWSKDLEFIYHIREDQDDDDLRMKSLARRFLQRIQSFKDVTIIPNGLISASHTGPGHSENVCLAILEKKGNLVNWIQVDPGSIYNQHYNDVVGEKSNAYLIITEIDPANITNDLLYLLVGLKSVHPGRSRCYENMSLYECLLSHLNGKTTFQSEPDEGFITSSHTSPVHTWQVIDKSFCRLLQYLIPDSYRIYQRLILNFKLFLFEKTLDAYEKMDKSQSPACHFLLQEMIRDIAQGALDQGNKQQKNFAFQLINAVKSAIKQHSSEDEQKICCKFNLNKLNVLSLGFVAPRWNKRTPISRNVKSLNLQVIPVFVKPTMEDDIIFYLEELKNNVIDKLVNATDIRGIALLSYSIEVFLIDYLGNSHILQKAANVPFSNNDTFLANTLLELAEIYFGCQSKLVKVFLSNVAYQPQFYAKNVTIQFFVYAAIAALNLRDPTIGPLLESYNLSVSASESVSLNNTIPRLVIEGSQWVKVLLATQDFFALKEKSRMLFSSSTFELTNTSDKTVIDVDFAYRLLKKYPRTNQRFIDKYNNLETDKLCRKWANLAFTDTYLPSIYFTLSKIANFARVSLMGPLTIRKRSPFATCNHVKTAWFISPKNFELQSCYPQIKFKVNSYVISNKQYSDKLTSYTIDSSSYQRFISRSSENKIIATQNKKPETMGCTRYMQLGFLQSEPQIKLERLYIALKENQLDFCCKEEGIIIKQTLFEISVIKNADGKACSLLEWICHYNSALIHAFGVLCIEKARAMRYRLTQHHAIGDILTVTLGLLSFYPTDYRETLIEGIMDIYSLLKENLAEPPAQLNDCILLHLNAYLIIAVQAKPQILESDILIILKALVDIQNFKVKGSKLDNNWLIQVYTASFTWCSLVEDLIAQNPALLNDLIRTVIPEWHQGSSWQKDEDGLLYTSDDHAVEPLLGCIYFQNQQIRGLPHKITSDAIFKEFLGEETFPVRSSSCEIDAQFSCYVSVDRTPELRLTLTRSALLIEEKVGTEFQRYIPSQELLGHSHYSCLLYESPHNQEKLQHWLDKDENILIKDKQRKIIFKWDMHNWSLFSLEHGGFVIPWKQLEDSFFKKWLEYFEPSTWIEIIAASSSSISDIQIQSLNFPRLGLYFDHKDGKFFCKQVHNYFLAKKQHVNILHGFKCYMVLEFEEQNTVRTKVIIPHHKIKPKGGLFYVRKAIVNYEVRSPAYFIYDYDQKMGVLKGHHIRAHFFLALLYFRTPSFDDNNVSDCNSYHLARENLELCWKDQPYDNVELNIIEQFLDVSAMKCLHSHSVALALKVVSLLSSSLRLAFLFTDKAAQQSKKKSIQLLQNFALQTPNLFLIYMQNKTTIFERIKLSVEEEKDVAKYYSAPFLSINTKRYNMHYKNLFLKESLISTEFLGIFKEYIQFLSFAYDTNGINFSADISGILNDQLRPDNVITLYKLAKRSVISLTKYRYLLHHLLIKAVMDSSSFPVDLAFMLAKFLLLVAERPTEFPNVPSWYNESVTVNLSKRRLIKREILKKFPVFDSESDDESDEDEIVEKRARLEDKNEKAEEQVKQVSESENEGLWSNLARYDLDDKRVPLCIPKTPRKFTLQYENHLNFNRTDVLDEKLAIVRKCYLEASFNNSMYKFFVCILQKCDELKEDSEMGWPIAPFTHKIIPVSINADEERFLPAQEPLNLVRWAVQQQPLINLQQFFACDSQPQENSDFLFESQLGKLKTGYDPQFYGELKTSWLAYTNEQKCSYSWFNPNSVNELVSALQAQYSKIHNRAEEIWSQIESQLKQRSSSDLNDYFALRWYSGRVRHYLKCDILRLLIEPHLLVNYNPDCVQNSDRIIRELLEYVTHEINSAKIVRALSLIEQYKRAQVSEQFSVLQSLVKNLQEEVDDKSYRHPHWFLFQFENEIILRANQCELIVAMLDQTNKAMYQLNMGEGKTSVILPLLGYDLANGKQLVRINVLSSLLTTMTEFLRQRFSGLIRKHIYTLPFNRDTDISAENLALIFETLQRCQDFQHFLLITPEERMCLQLKIRELMLQNQQQIGATNIFNWETYRQRTHSKTELYQDLDEEKIEEMLREQDEFLGDCLRKEGYIDTYDNILELPPPGQGYSDFVRFKENSKNVEFREWSCLNAAYCELLYNSTLAQDDCRKKLALLNKISTLTTIDLLDESDEILKHGTELNFTLGDKHVFAGGKLRWEIPQFFIKTIFCDPDVKDVITAGKADGSTTINLHFNSQASVPFIQLLNESYYRDKIKPLLIDKFFQENLSTLRKYQCSIDSPLIEGELSSLKEYVAGQLPLSTEKKIISVLLDKGPLKDKLLIAKGWMSHGILYHVFNAKYRVQYGLNVNAKGQVLKQIAIPFFGKDAPSPRSEFSHPDVMLGLTIISYLYQGLNQTQLKETINKLKSKFSPPVADMCLREWIAAGRTWIERQTDEFVPLFLTSFQNFDLEDDYCLKEVHRYLSRNYLTILFYLNQFVFLEEAMQYLFKISANAHSLVGYNAALGFSGTDDRKITMPFQVKSLVTQKGTNGKLLSVLTQERNCDYHSLEMEDTVNLLEKLSDYASTQRNCHVLIDAGALITGLSNFAVAEFLLCHLPSHFLGIVYFSDEGNSLTVLTRDKKIMALQDCYLDIECLFVYLDDIHTRGTDIKLSSNCHAILTIGMGMQKDKLMQAAMRLRQLAEKQSVSLWGSQAVTFAIARDNKVDVGSINSREVLKWVTENTINNINTDLFYVAVRRINFQFLKKAEAWLKEAPTTSINTLVQYCQERESFQLEEFYALSPQCEDLGDRLYYFVSARLLTFWQGFEQELRHENPHETDFHQKLLDKNAFRKLLLTICDEVTPYLQSGYLRSSLDNNEEKEMEVEIVQEQQIVSEVRNHEESIENPWNARLILKKSFITLATKKEILMPLHKIEGFIQMPTNLKNIVWHENIYMTSNFINSVLLIGNEGFDNFLRPVDCILIHRSGPVSNLVLLSGQEAAQICATCLNMIKPSLLTHINDINGPTQLPVGSYVSEKEQKLLTIVKLFAGECHYTSMKEVRRLAKRVGRIYPLYFTCLDLSNEFSEKLFGILIDEQYLDFAGVMTEKLLKILRRMESEDSFSIKLPIQYESYNQCLLKKLHGIFMKLIISSSVPLKDSHSVLSQWVETRGKLKEYPGSALESILDSEYNLKFSQ